MSSDLQWALDELAVQTIRLKAYQSYLDYYEGKHPLAFATDKYRTTFWRLFSRLSDNLCLSVVDVQTERLEIVGFTSNRAREVEETDPEDEGTVIATRLVDPPAEEAWNLWEQQDLDLVADEAHRDAVMYGDGFLMAGDDGRLYPQEPRQMAVRYSSSRPGELEAGAKMWLETNDHWRVTVYLPGVVERWESINPHQEGIPTPEREQSYRLLSRDAAAARVPIIHFANKKFSGYGASELEPVLPIQDALNKALCDLVVAMEYQAFKQRWITGVEVEIDPDTGQPKAFRADHGPGHFLAIPGEDVDVGEFDAADMGPFLSVIRDLRGEIARVTGIPLHYFFVTSAESPSGEALKVGEMRFTKKTKKQQRLFGRQWERALAMSLDLSDSAVEVDDELDLNAVWSDETPRSESEVMDVLSKKMAIGVPIEQLQKEAGYDDDQIASWAKQRAANAPDVEPDDGAEDEQTPEA
jgi:hypothetical protein